MPRVGLDPRTVFERAKTFHALDRAATVIGNIRYKEESIVSNSIMPRGSKLSACWWKYSLASREPLGSLTSLTHSLMELSPS
jgi:hypothetical protein